MTSTKPLSELALYILNGNYIKTVKRESRMTKNELFSKIQKAIVELDEQHLAKLTAQLIESGIDLVEAIEKAYTVGIRKVGDLFDTGEYFLPELIKGGK